MIWAQITQLPGDVVLQLPVAGNTKGKKELSDLGGYVSLLCSISGVLSSLGSSQPEPGVTRPKAFHRNVCVGFAPVAPNSWADTS